MQLDICSKLSTIQADFHNNILLLLNSAVNLQQIVTIFDRNLKVSLHCTLQCRDFIVFIFTDSLCCCGH